MTGGFLIKIWDGRLLQAGTTNLGAASFLVVEATVMRNGVQVAVQAWYRSIVLEGDNQVLIKALRREVGIPCEIQTITEDRKMYLNSYNQVYIQHIF